MIDPLFSVEDTVLGSREVEEHYMSVETWIKLGIG